DRIRATSRSRPPGSRGARSRGADDPGRVSAASRCREPAARLHDGRRGAASPGAGDGAAGRWESLDRTLRTPATGGAVSRAALRQNAGVSSTDPRRSSMASRHPVNRTLVDQATRGDRIADAVTSFLGSWRFIIVQSILVAAWVAGNVYLV